MKQQLFLVFFALAIRHSQAQSSYVAAVVEFYSLGGTFRQNIGKYEDLIADAKSQAAEIIVFPEYGLTTTAVSQSRSLCINVGQEVPALDSNPCLDFNNDTINTEALKRLSCAARNNSIYVVANLIERQFCGPQCAQDNYLIYNSNVAFDANGTLVARYRKFNLYGEPALNTTAETDIAVFTTSFGATFGTFTCMDLLFYNPSVRLVREFGATDIAFPTAWFSELPYLTAVQGQSAWALGLGVNFLGSGYNHPAVGNSGSGIYSGEKGEIVSLMAQQSGTTLLVATVPLNTRRQSRQSRRAKRGAAPPAAFDLLLKNDNLRDYTSAALSAEIGANLTLTHCQADLCCTVDYELESVDAAGEFNYRLVVIDGIVTHDGGHYVNREQVCSVIACAGANTTSCSDDLEFSTYSASTVFKSLSVSGNFSTDLLQPNTLLVPSLAVLRPTEDYNFETNSAASVSQMGLTKSISNLHTFGLFAHDFEPPTASEVNTEGLNQEAPALL
ncbi:vanin-like protein 1 [Neocloeon triangulifer]|uniref:vanin-like protein 1 n=1 Tax=Neocloeon triangulifer TaxID=2078957 RepID=UPI00286F4786|nr:vanin-like protein 1 [Neocloeon triangulifer]